MREVITDNGIYGYKIESGNFYDYIYVYKKEVWRRKKWMLFGKIIEHYYWKRLERGSSNYITKFTNTKSRVKVIKNSINEIILRVDSFDPDWDGMMVSDKQKLREILLNDLIIENEDN